MYNTALRPAPELTEKYFPSSPKLWIDISIANLISFRNTYVGFVHIFLSEFLEDSQGTIQPNPLDSF